MDNIYKSWKVRALVYGAVYVLVIVIMSGLGIGSAWAWGLFIMMLLHKTLLRYLL